MLTEDEKKNGWTEEKLKRYHREQEERAARVIHRDREVKPNEQNHRYNPLRWRK